MSELSTKDVLVKAREVYAANPGKGSLCGYRDGKDCYCALGAIAYGSGITDRDDLLSTSYVHIHPAAVKALADTFPEDKRAMSDDGEDVSTDTVWGNNDSLLGYRDFHIPNPEGVAKMLEHFDAAIAAQDVQHGG